MNKFQEYKNKILSNGLLSDSVYSVSSKALAMVLYMISDILIARYLTFQLYGEWTYYYSIATILFVVGRFGINSATQVFVAGSGFQEEKKGFIISGLVVRVGMSVLLGIVLLLVLPNIAVFFGYPGKYAELKRMFFLMPVLIFGNTLVDFFKCLYIGTVEFKKVFLITILEYLGLLVFGAGTLALTSSVLVLNLGYVFSYLIVACAGYMMIRPVIHKEKAKHAVKIYFDRIKVEKILRYSIPILLTGILSVLLMDMDTFMLGLLLEPGESGVYSIAKSFLTKATNFNIAIASSTMTAFAIVTKENAVKKRKLFLQLNAWNILSIILVCIVCLILGKWGIVLLYGDEYIGAVKVLYALLPYYSFFSMSVFPATYLNYQQLAAKSLGCNVIMFICNLFLNLLLIPEYGAMGAAIATSVAIVPYVLLLYIATFRNFKMLLQ